MLFVSNSYPSAVTRYKRLATTLMLTLAVAFPALLSAQTSNGQPIRPFWIYAHNPNTLANIADAVNHGANALEPDIMVFPNSTCPNVHIINKSESDHYIYHDATCPIRTLSTLEEYLIEVRNQVVAGKNIALLALDIKGPSANPSSVNGIWKAVHKYLNTDGVNVNIIYSVGNETDVTKAHAFDYIMGNLADNEGIQIDGANDPFRVYNDLGDEAKRVGAPGKNRSFGNGSFLVTYGLAPNVLPSIMEASWLRASQFKTGFSISYAFPIPANPTFHPLYADWTQDFIDAGVDGLISDADEQPQIWSDTTRNIATMHSRITNPPLNKDFYPATAADNPWTTRHPGYALRVDTFTPGKGHRFPATNEHITFTLTGSCGVASVTINANHALLFGAGDRNYVTIPSKNLGRLTQIELSSATGEDTWNPSLIQISSAEFGIPYDNSPTSPTLVPYTNAAVDDGDKHNAIMSLPQLGYDCAPPSASPSQGPPPNGAGWNNSDVVVYWFWADKSGAGLDYARCPASTYVTETGTVSATCYDNLGNSATASHSVRIDKTPPTATCGAADGLWRAVDVTISCLPHDDGSGLVSPAAFTLTTSVPALTETSNALTNRQLFQDIAGNYGDAGPIGGNKVDKKPPVITIQPASAQYTHSQTLNYTVTDGGSGVASVTLTLNGNAPVAGNSLGGGAIPLLTSLPLGPNTLLISSADKVGNKSSLPATFTIIVTPPSMIDEVTQFAASGAITGDPAPLLVPLRAAAVQAAAGNCAGAVTQWLSFINLVNTAIGTTPNGIIMTQAAGTILIRDTQYLLTVCGYGG